jgi:hypothetical protein
LLFNYADSKDKLFMFIGYIACIAAGVTLPSMSLLFGNLSGGVAAGNTDKVKD